MLSLHGAYSSIHEPKQCYQKCDGKMNDYSSICVVIMDFKIKFETMKHRKNVVGDFGNKGLSWHGTLVFHSVWVCVEPYVYYINQ